MKKWTTRLEEGTFRVLDALLQKKAPGADNISNRVLKRFTRKALVALANIINAILRLNYLKIIETGKRPAVFIKLLTNQFTSAMSKIDERVIANRIEETTKEQARTLYRVAKVAPRVCFDGRERNLGTRIAFLNGGLIQKMY